MSGKSYSSQRRREHTQGAQAGSRCPRCGRKIRDGGHHLPGAGIVCARCSARAGGAESGATDGASR